MGIETSTEETIKKEYLIPESQRSKIGICFSTHFPGNRIQETQNPIIYKDIKGANIERYEDKLIIKASPEKLAKAKKTLEKAMNFELN